MFSRMSLLEVAAALRRRDVTSSRLVDHCLARVEIHEPRIRAWVSVDAVRALDEAKRLDEELAAGKDRGPLHGIPIGVKDIVDVAGLPTAAGSPLLGKEPARQDARVVARLREAGAVVLGKTVTTEFACFDPSRARNPWNVGHTPGGSSSGSAAATALGMCLAAVGSQTGGSITRPASYCGVAGFKPTLGRVSTEGVHPVSFTLDHVGPIARRVVDLSILLQAMAEPDSACGLAPVWDLLEPLSTASFLETKPRLGLIEGFFLDEPESAQSVLAAAETFTDAGADVARVKLPESFAVVHKMHRRVMAAEAAEQHRELFRREGDSYGPAVRGLVEEGLELSAADYAEALKARSRFQREMVGALSTVDALLTPATPTAAPPWLQSTGDPKFNSPWSFAGLPTASFPSGLNSDGMPSAVQLIGNWGGENQLLQVA
ncbi:MAG: amidase, partial [Planctomycetales bacterium]